MQPQQYANPTFGSQSLSPEGTQTLADSIEPSPEKKREITGFRWILICVAVYSANLVYGLDTTITATVQAAVSDTYDNTSELGWLGVGFALGSVSAMGPIGKAYGVFNIKWLYVGCLAMFTAASALCGAAPNMNGMIIGRVWAGFAGAGMYLGTLNIFTRITTPVEQPVYIGGIAFINGVGEILGPIIGGRFADSVTWRWGFYINLLIFVVMGPVYVFVIPPLPNQADRSFRQKIMGLDLLGVLLSIAAYGTFTVAFTFGGVIWPWKDGRTISLIIVSGVLVIVFCVTQYYAVLTNKNDRIFPCHFFSNTQINLLNVCTLCAQPALFSSLYYIPLYFLFVDGATGTEAAVRLLPFVMVYIFSILFCAMVMRRTGWYIIWFLITGSLMTASGVAMYVVLDIDTPKAQLYGISAILGVGFATSMSGYALAPRLVSEEQAPFVIQLLTISQGQGQLIGLAVASAIFQTKSISGLSHVLHGYGFSNEDIGAAISGARSVVLQSVDADTLSKCMRVIVRSIADCWLITVVCGALYVACSCFLTRKRFMT